MKTTLNPSSFQSARPEEFDLVILGGGTGSTVAAWTFAHSFCGGYGRDHGRRPGCYDCGVALHGSASQLSSLRRELS